MDAAEAEEEAVWTAAVAAAAEEWAVTLVKETIVLRPAEVVSTPCGRDLKVVTWADLAITTWEIEAGDTAAAEAAFETITAVVVVEVEEVAAVTAVDAADPLIDRGSSLATVAAASEEEEEKGREERAAAAAAAAEDPKNSAS